MARTPQQSAGRLLNDGSRLLAPLGAMELESSTRTTSHRPRPVYISVSPDGCKCCPWPRQELKEPQGLGGSEFRAYTIGLRD